MIKIICKCRLPTGLIDFHGMRGAYPPPDFVHVRTHIIRVTVDSLSRTSFRECRPR